jgi:hypothetical protein
MYSHNPLGGDIKAPSGRYSFYQIVGVINWSQLKFCTINLQCQRSIIKIQVDERKADVIGLR